VLEYLKLKSINRRLFLMKPAMDLYPVCESLPEKNLSCKSRLVDMGLLVDAASTKA